MLRYLGGGLDVKGFFDNLDTSCHARGPEPRLGNE
jgi:hypothetical protein